MKYKTLKRKREASQRYYERNKQQERQAATVRRRAKGVGPRKPARTIKERLARVLLCRVCGEQVTTPSYLLIGQQTCRRCIRQRRDPVKRWQSVTKQREKLRMEVQAAKLAKGCQRCGYKTNDPKELDWHHRNPKTKLFKLAQANRRSGVQVRAEMVKCDVLCKTCHKKQH